MTIFSIDTINSAATVIATWFAFRAITHSYKMNREDKHFQRRHATVEFASDPEKGLPALSRPIRACAEQRHNEQCQKIHASNEIDEDTKIRIIKNLSHGKYGFLNFHSEYQNNTIIEKILFSGAQSVKETPEEYDAYRAFFNLLEDTANGIFSDVYDIHVLNKMYGGMIQKQYTNGLHWINTLRRKHGARYYDQSERLAFELMKINNYTTYDAINWKILLFLISKAEIFSCLSMIFRKENRIPLPSRPDYDSFLKLRGLWQYRDELYEMAEKQMIEIKNITKDIKFSLRGRIQNIAHNVYIDTKGVWPVGVNENMGWDHVTAHDLENWNKRVERYWGTVLGAFISRPDKHKLRVLAGIISIKKLCEAPEEQEVWRADIRNALHSLYDNDEDIVEFLQHSGIKLSDSSDEKHMHDIDLSNTAIIRSLMVDPEYRHGSTGHPIGRTLFRQALQIIRSQYGMACLLSVIADSPATSAAVHIYKTEGGVYLGKARDRGREDGHMMHYFIF